MIWLNSGWPYPMFCVFTYKITGPFDELHAYVTCCRRLSAPRFTLAGFQEVI